jgi:hypothetical protein
MKSFLTKVLWVGAFGAGVLVVLGYPLVFALIAYVVAHWTGVPSPILWAKWTGFCSLFLCPMVIAGNALRVSLNRARQREWTPPQKGAGPTNPCPELPQNENPVLKEVVEVWKTAVGVQQHFNDLELRIRNFAVTLLVAVIGAAAFALKEHYEVHLLSHPFSLAVAVLTAGILGWLAFYFMDRHWYHRLLLGSVRHTVERIEARHSSFPELALSERIGRESAIRLWALRLPRNQRTHWMEIHSSEKIDLFYAAGLLFLMILILALVLLGSTAPSQASEARPRAEATLQ